MGRKGWFKLVVIKIDACVRIVKIRIRNSSNSRKGINLEFTSIRNGSDVRSALGWSRSCFSVKNSCRYRVFERYHLKRLGKALGTHQHSFAFLCGVDQRQLMIPPPTPHDLLHGVVGDQERIFVAPDLDGREGLKFSLCGHVGKCYHCRCQLLRPRFLNGDRRGHVSAVIYATDLDA